MLASPSAGLDTLLERSVRTGLGVVAGLAASMLQLDAVANRFVNKLGVDGVNFKVSSLIDTVLKPAAGAGKVEIKNLVVAVVALVLLGAVVYFLFSVLGTLSGRRGGIEGVGRVIFALIVGIAGLEVLA
jgi:hypothetical protein